MKPKDIEYYSNCCGAFLGPWYEDSLLCPECGEHCAKVTEDEEG